MKKIPITLEQYECIECMRKWYINTDDKNANEMRCPYGCEALGNITRKFDMVINNYEEYQQSDMPTLNDEKGVERSSSTSKARIGNEVDRSPLYVKGGEE